MTRRNAVWIMGAVVLLAARDAEAALPTNVWQRAGATGGTFSADGSVVLLTITNGFELHRSSDGALLGTITLPAASPGYDTFAFSPDHQRVATTKRENGISRIDIWRTSDGALERTINTPAVRNIKSLSLSSTGFVASMERFAYGGGGMMWVHRVSDGALLMTQGPYTRSSTTEVRFAPGGQYLEALDRVSANGFRILRTSDWGTAFTLGDGSAMMQWSNDGAAFFTYGSSYYGVPFEKVGVPSGSVLHSVAIDDALQLYITSVTPDGGHYLAYQPTSTDPSSPPGDVIVFLSGANGAVELTYQMPDPLVFSGQVSPTGTLFGYGVCIGGTDCTYTIARMPALGGITAVPALPGRGGVSLELAGANPARTFDMRFNLSRDGRASLAVHDVTGKLVRTIGSGTLASGEHVIAWDGRDGQGRETPAGIYFLRLDALGEQAGKRVVRLP